MKLIIFEEVQDIIFKRVFGNTLLKQSILYYLKNNNVSEFTLYLPSSISSRAKKEILQDNTLKGIPIEIKDDAVNEQAIPLNRLYDLEGHSIDIKDTKDLAGLRSLFRKQILKNCSTPIARYINKRVSLPISNILARLCISPNVITLIALLWSVAGALCLLKKEYFVWGFVCFQINSILDGSDGEVARFNLQTTRLGKKLDVYSDYITSILIIVFEGIGFYMITLKHWVFVLGCVNIICLVCIGMIGGFVFMSGLTPKDLDDVEAICHQKLKYPKTFFEKISRLFLFLSRRDFYIFVLMILAVSHQFEILHVFLTVVCLSWLVLTVFTLRGCR